MDNTIGFPNTYPINYPVDSAVIGLKQLALKGFISGVQEIRLRSRRLEVVGERENGCARGRHACLLLARPFLFVPTTSKRLLAGNRRMRVSQANI